MMFANISNLAGSFSSYLSVVATLTALVFAAFGAKTKLNVAALEESNQILRDNSGDKDIKITALSTENTSLKQTNQALTDLKTQAQPIAKLITQNGKQHQDVMVALAAVIESNGKMATEIGNVAKALNKG